MNIEKTIENLKKNNMETFLVKSREEARVLALSMIPEGAVCAHGGSVTLNECGITEALKCGKYTYLDRNNPALTAEEKEEMMLRAQTCDVYLSSSNAITEEGELYNVDGNSNRVSNLLYGPKKVIFVAGVNKIVKDLDEAVVRVKTVAAPLNCKRLGCNTYCAKEGKCVSLVQGGNMPKGCNSDDRICVNFTVMARQRKKDRVKVILVEEELGY
ncbi:MAG: lactate utilization protein [Clostridia bacterium]|nr:lactate utilization protein [Clostridia bacterium]